MAATDSTGQSPRIYTWYRGFVQGKTRITLAWIAAILLGLTARELPHWPGLALCFAGATLRYWASGYLRKDTRPAVGGPYAYVRNPLYLGTYLMALGAAWAIENWWLLGAMTVIFAAVYHYIILDEETKLARIFGPSYELYRSLVPRFFPRILPVSKAKLLKVNPESLHLAFSRELAAKNKAIEAYFSFLGIVAYISGMAFLWKTLS